MQNVLFNDPQLLDAINAIHANIAKTEPDTSTLSLSSLNIIALAKSMFDVARDDLKAVVEPADATDLFGFCVQPTFRQVDALIWVFGINPDGQGLSFEWVCDQLDMDAEIFRRVIARNMSKEIRAALVLLESMVGRKTMAKYIDRMSEYLNLDGWRNILH